jgi:hypothetical protein
MSIKGLLVLLFLGESDYMQSMGQKFSKTDKWFLTIGHLIPTFVPPFFWLTFLMYFYEVDLSGNAIPDEDVSHLMLVNLSFIAVAFALPVLGLYLYKRLIYSRMNNLRGHLDGALKFNIIWRLVIVFLLIFAFCSLVFLRQFLTPDIQSPLILALSSAIAALGGVIYIYPVIAVVQVWRDRVFRYPFC